MSNPIATVRPARLLAGLALAAAALAGGPRAARGQPPDSLRIRRDTLADTAAAGRPQLTPRGRQRAAPVRDTVAGPPISPRRAFLYSFAVPGLGQAKLHRPNAGALFVSIEFLALALARKAAVEVEEAQQFRRDSIVERWEVNATTGEVTPVFARNRFGGNRLRARRTHYEDWIALLIFNHLFAGADAFVAANLWDLPEQVEVRGGSARRAGRREVTISASVAW